MRPLEFLQECISAGLILWGLRCFGDVLTCPDICTHFNYLRYFHGCIYDYTMNIPTLLHFFKVIFMGMYALIGIEKKWRAYRKALGGERGAGSAKNLETGIELVSQ